MKSEEAAALKKQLDQWNELCIKRDNLLKLVEELSRFRSFTQHPNEAARRIIIRFSSDYIFDSGSFDTGWNGEPIGMGMSSDQITALIKNFAETLIQQIDNQLAAL